MLEDAVREMFAARIDKEPALDDPVGVAIRRARRKRRRRRGAVTVTLVVLGAFLSGGLAVVQNMRNGGPAPERFTTGVMDAPMVEQLRPSEMGKGPSPRVDLFARGRVWTMEGLRLSVATPEWDVVRVYRVPAGWLVGGRTETRLVRLDKVIVPLPIGTDWVVSADGQRVAYATSGELRIATLGKDGLKPVATTGIAGYAIPLAFAGDDIVVGLTDTEGNPVKLDFWRPGSTGYRPVWGQAVAGVYDSNAPDVLGLVPAPGGGEPCFTRFSLTDGTARAEPSSACGLEPIGGGWPDAAISPDGRWLAMPAPSKVDIYDLRTVLGQPAAARTCWMPATMGLVWESATTLLAADRGTAMRCHMDGTTEPAALPQDLPSGWRFVPSRVG